MMAVTPDRSGSTTLQWAGYTNLREQLSLEITRFYLVDAPATEWVPTVARILPGYMLQRHCWLAIYVRSPDYDGCQIPLTVTNLLANNDTSSVENINCVNLKVIFNLKSCPWTEFSLVAQRDLCSDPIILSHNFDTMNDFGEGRLPLNSKLSSLSKVLVDTCLDDCLKSTRGLENIHHGHVVISGCTASFQLQQFRTLSQSG